MTPRQLTFATNDFEFHRKPTRRERTLQQLNDLVPWKKLCALVAPHYPKHGKPGRRAIGLERMLRIHCLQHVFNLSDPAAEEAIYDSNAMRAFVGIDLGRESAPDETTILKFRHLLERHDLGKKVFQVIQQHLAEKGMYLRKGTIVDATIIEAPTSTKNKENARDPEIKQTKKGNEWHFGMKAHIGVDHETKLVHTVVATSANVHDSQILPDLLLGEELAVWGDSAYTGQGEAIAAVAPQAIDNTQKRAYRNKALTESEIEWNHRMSSIRARVEHPFLILKRTFGFDKVRYRGISKNANRLFFAFGLANLFMVKKRLLGTA
jgi:IS5 family transposase